MENNDSVQDFLEEIEAKAKKPARGSGTVRKAAGLDSVDKLLPNVLSKLGLDRRLKEHAAMQIWISLLPGPILERSRPLFIDSQRNLVVAVADAAVAQELSLMKGKLLRTFIETVRTIGVEVKGIRIDMKHFHRAAEPQTPEPLNLPQPDETDLMAFELDSQKRHLVLELEDSLASDHESLVKKEKILRAFEMQLRLAQWRREHGYPICDYCDNPVLRLYPFGKNKVCFNCRAAANRDAENFEQSL